MPVSTGSLGEPRAKRCKHCDESSHRSESGSGYWQLQLDKDLVDTISAIYPEWFKNNMAEGSGGGGGGGSGGVQPSTPRASPPKAVIDTSPLLLEQNKESLKVKLMLRRPFDQLVAQGIMPPHKTPAAYHGQRRQLERAKTGDMLKQKIQQRPPRQELERRHILEADPGHVDPSIAERQRMLKKARLADQLNDQLSHRPGPLELIQKNILHTEEPIEHAVKAGRIPYKATCEGQLNRPQHPQVYINQEDDSQSSEGDNLVSPGPSDVIETAAKSAGIVVSLIPATEGTVVVTTAVAPVLNKDNSEIVFPDLCRSVTGQLLSQASASSPASLVSSTSTLSPLSSVASPVPSIVSQPATPIPPPMPVALTPRPLPSPAKSDAPGKDKNRKKSKSKSAPKARTIKFHEYKGPPSAQKTSNSNSGNTTETSYDLLLQQQTLLLQFQLQLQHKYPQIILPASQKNQSDSNTSIGNQTQTNLTTTSTDSSRLLVRLEDMKVSDLKAELKRRSLPVSGSKPQLIQRLKPYAGCNDANQESSISSTNMDESHCSPKEQGSPQNNDMDEQMDISDPLSPATTTQDSTDIQQNLQQNIQQSLQQSLQQSIQQNLQQNLQRALHENLEQNLQQKSQEDIVREQQKRIEELQRELTLSQMKLQAAARGELQKHIQARKQQQMVVQMQQLQDLQAKQQQKITQEEQRLQQQRHVAFQNQKNLPGGLLLNGTDAALVLNLMQGKAKLINGHNRANSLPNFFIAAPEIKTEFKEEKPPPLYEEATKQMKKEKSNVKSQIVDDVLDILIKNGELPPSAAQDPSTPNSAGTRSTEPVFPNNNNNDNNSNNNNNNNNINTTTETAPDNDVTGLGIDDTADLLESLDSLEDMDFNQLVMELHQSNDNQTNNVHDNDTVVPMDTDDWLESLLPRDNNNTINSAPLATQETDLTAYDPLLGITQGPFDPVSFYLDEYRPSTDLNSTTLTWDKLDFAA